MTWTLLSISEFKIYSLDWQHIVDKFHSQHPLLDIRFVTPLIEEFGGDNTLLAIESNNNETVAAMLLTSPRRGVIDIFSPSQCQISLAVGKPHTRKNSMFIGLLDTIPGYGWLLGIKNYDMDYSNLVTHEDTRVESMEYGNTMSLKIEGSFENYWKERSRNLRKNIKRYLRRAENDGVKIWWEELTAENEMKMAVRRYGDLESAGWKGENGTAIHADNKQGKFYAKILENFAHENNSRVYNLYLDNQLISSRLTIKQNGIMVILKTTYDERYAKYAPGKLLLYFIIKNAFEKGELDLIEFYTRATTDQLQWCTHHRMIYHLNIYRSGYLKRFITMARGLRLALRFNKRHV